MRFVHPEALLLAPPLLWMIWHTRSRWIIDLLRTALALCLVMLLAAPWSRGSVTGRDLILVVDRSRSMPPAATARVEEIAREAARRASPGDRVGLVAFGRNAVVEAPPAADYAYAPPAKAIDRDATDLAGALDTALALIRTGTAGSIVVVSDGRVTGADPAAAAREALRRGIRIDSFHSGRSGALDLAVEDLQTPSRIEAGEPFQFSAWVRSDRATDARVRLIRDGEVVAHGTRKLHSGLNRVVFRDRLTLPGIHRYEVAVDIEGDAVVENNRGRSVVRAVGPQRVLCVTPHGRADRLTRSLAVAGLRVVVAGPAQAPLDLDRLDGFRAVVLENVAAGDLPRGGLAALGRFVHDLGGGLLMTGGKASFGPGGYYQSDVERALPVSMELREEQRKFHVAMAIVLDRSGSMQRRAGTRTKMDLANLGTCAAIELLGPLDSVAVIAVDSSPHVVVGAQPVRDRDDILGRVRSIESRGGGIFTYTGLRAAAEQLDGVPQTTRHIVLFADAADAEEPGDYIDLIAKLRRQDTTVSVIGLGAKTDKDAAFLADIARRGAGRCFFVADAADLPRVFAQETIQVARSSVVEEPAAVVTLPALHALGSDLPDLPGAGGYSIAYAKPGAQVGAVTSDDQKAPFFSFWQHGLGRAAAFLGEADGALSGPLASWSGYGVFFSSVLRWLSRSEAGDAVFADVRREGHEAVLRVELAKGHEALVGDLEASVLGPDGRRRPVLLARVGEREFEARIALRGTGVYRASVRAGDRGFVRVPPITLPYSPEFEYGFDPEAGERTLARITRITEGRLEPRLAELFSGVRESRDVRPLARLFAWFAVLLLVAEIAVRRLALGLPVWRPRRRTKQPAAPADDEPVETDAGIASVLDRARARGTRRR